MATRSPFRQVKPNAAVDWPSLVFFTNAIS